VQEIVHITPYLFYFFYCLVERKLADVYARGPMKLQVFVEMAGREWIIGRMQSKALLLEIGVEIVEEMVGWVVGVGFGKSATEVGGDELGACNHRAPCLGNAPESDERLHGQSREDFDDHLVREIV
jgi:hypothetical protein